MIGLAMVLVLISAEPSAGRVYGLVVPPCPPTALIIVLHGGGVSLEDTRAMAAVEGDCRLVAYPRALQDHQGVFQWDYGPEACTIEQLCARDVGFIQRLLGILTQRYPGIPAIVAGFSGGGFVLLQAACRGAWVHYPVSVVAVASSLTTSGAPGCQVARWPLYLFNAVDDPVIPLSGIGGTFSTGVGVRGGISVRGMLDPVNAVVYTGGHVWPPGATTLILQLAQGPTSPRR